MKDVTFADVALQSITFRADVLSEALALELIDTAWFQRLRDISQTANTRLVYMFSEHSRFGHSMGVAYLANLLMDKLERIHGKQVNEYRCAVSAAALLHDIGHLAPGSHTAFKTWFPDSPDTHEELAIKIIQEDPDIQGIFKRYGQNLTEQVALILKEDSGLPAWTWEIISGGGWNADRGNWCVVDSILAGVSYGQYNLMALLESIRISDDGHLAVRENRLDAMMHFAVSRHAMYRQIYQHRVILAADSLNQAIVKRARAINPDLPFVDPTMRRVLELNSPDDLDRQTVFRMRESWWRYHLTRWHESKDEILSDLCDRLLNRKLFKTVRIRRIDDAARLHSDAENAVRECGYDPAYYLHEASTVYLHEGDSEQSMLVTMDDGRIRTMQDAEPLFDTMTRESSNLQKAWLILPEEAKAKLGRSR